MSAALLYDVAIWRIQPQPQGDYAFGPIHLDLKLDAGQRRYFNCICATPRHGLLFSEIEALEFLPQATRATVAKLNAGVRQCYKTALQKRFGQNIDIGIPLLTQVTTGYWQNKPVAVVSSAASIITVFMLGLNSGLNSAERMRLTRLTKRRWLARDLRALPKFYADWRDRSATSITYAGARSRDAYWQVWQGFVSSSGGEGMVWPALPARHAHEQSLPANFHITHYPWRRQDAAPDV